MNKLTNEQIKIIDTALKYFNFDCVGTYQGLIGYCPNLFSKENKEEIKYLFRQHDIATIGDNDVMIALPIGALIIIKYRKSFTTYLKTEKTKRTNKFVSSLLPVAITTIKRFSSNLC